MYEKIINHFGGINKLAVALGVSHPAVCQWAVNGIPAARAIQIEVLTRGKFKAIEIVKIEGSNNE